MDEFFQKLRKIQKKERNESGLARVGEDFYKRVHRYLEELMDTVGNDPFAKEQYLLRDTQRIATEICERREHKITDSAVMNIQRSYHLFKGKPQFDLQDTTPLNLTPEEEKLYFSLIDTLKGYRGQIIPSLDVLDDHDANNSVIQKPASKTDISKSKILDSNIDNPLSNNLSNDQLSSKSDNKQLDHILSDQDTNISRDDNQNTGSNAPDEDKVIFEKILQDEQKQNEQQVVNYLDEETHENEFKAPVKPEDLSKSKKLKSSKLKLDLKTVVIFSELPSIVGVDEKVYGPFCPQDVVKMPEINAQLFIKARKGRYIKT